MNWSGIEEMIGMNCFGLYVGVTKIRRCFCKIMHTKYNTHQGNFIKMRKCYSCLIDLCFYSSS